MKIEIEGRKKLAAKLGRSRRDVKSNMDRERIRSAEHLLSVAIPVTPLESGELRQSGFAEHDVDTSIVGFAAEHAIYVHEMPDTNTYTIPGTSGKFLERPFSEWKPVYRRNIIAAAKEGIG